MNIRRALPCRSGRGQLHAVFEQVSQIVGDDAFDHLAIGKADPQPQPLKLGPAQERLPLGLVHFGKFAHEIDAADLFQFRGAVLPIRSEHI